jgi:hypothetical protein
MAITANWNKTETTVRGDQTEVILPLQGLGEVDPKDDKLIADTLRDALPDCLESDPLWEKLKFDRKGCRLHMFVPDSPDVEKIKHVLDRALRQASDTITQNAKEREQAAKQAREQARRREHRAASVRDAFRGGVDNA